MTTNPTKIDCSLGFHMYTNALFYYTHTHTLERWQTRVDTTQHFNWLTNWTTYTSVVSLLFFFFGTMVCLVLHMCLSNRQNLDSLDSVLYRFCWIQKQFLYLMNVENGHSIEIVRKMWIYFVKYTKLFFLWTILNSS